MDVRADPTRQLVRLRGRSYVAFVFSPVVPIVVDLAAVDLSSSAIAHLVGSLNERSIRVLGIEGVDEERLAANMPPLLTGGRACVITRNEPAQKPEPEAKPKSNSLLLDSPVRSGQSVVFTEGDVTVLGSVGSGAEIVAGGSIHIYGALRGRAMAGVNGNSAARIFCQRIEAELLAIDGYYQTAEDIGPTLRNRPAQAWLEGDIMKIAPLN